VLATNLLVLLACKQYSAKPNVLIEFTPRTRALWSMPALRATNHLLRSSIKTITTTTAAHQPTWITACGETRIIGEPRFSQSTQYLSAYQPFDHTGAARERALPLKSTGIQGDKRRRRIHIYARVHTGLRLLSSTRRWMQTGGLTLLRYFYMRGVYDSSTSSVIHTPLGACRGFNAVELLRHAESAIGSCTTSVIHAPLEYTRKT